MWIVYQAISPRVCYEWAGRLLPWVILGLLCSAGYGLAGGLWLAPPDYQQGDAYRVMFVHVPAAVWSLGIYVIMAAAALIALVWKIKVADIIAKLSAPIGASLTLLALITGSIWGKP